MKSNNSNFPKRSTMFRYFEIPSGYLTNARQNGKSDCSFGGAFEFVKQAEFQGMPTS